MIKKLDWYIIKKFASALLFTIMIFTLISCVIDFSEKVKSFVEEEDLTAKQIFFDYYLNFIFYINGLLLPLYSLIAVIFVTSRMAFNSEIISILNAGVSFQRLLRPFLIVASTVFCIHLIGNHYYLPKSNVTRLKFERKYVHTHNDKGKYKKIHIFVSENSKVFINRYNKTDSIVNGLWVETFENDEIKSVLKAQRASWIREPNIWRLKNYTYHKFDGINESISVENKIPLDTAINFHPSDFVRFLNHKETMTSSEMKAYVKRDKARGISGLKEFILEIYRRSADAFTNIILVLIGVTIAARKVRGGIGFHLAVGIGLGAGFIFLSKFAITFATTMDVAPLIGVWIPNIIFSIISVYLFVNAQK